MASIQGMSQPGASYPIPTGAAAGYQHSFHSPNQQSNVGSQLQQMNGQPPEQQQSQAQQSATPTAMNHPAYYSTAGNAPSPGTGQLNSQAPTPIPTQHQQMTQQLPPQQIDPHLTAVPVAPPLSQQQQNFVPNGAHAQAGTSSYPGGSIPPLQTHGLTSQQALPPLN